jgi:hypothetical protein
VSGLLKESAYLWIITTAVVVTASLVHHWLAASDRENLRRGSKEQQKLEESDLRVRKSAG